MKRKRSGTSDQSQSRFKKKVSNQVPSNFPKPNKDWVSNPMSQKLKSENSPSDIPTCAKCDKKHRGEYMVGTEITLVVKKWVIRLGIVVM